MPSSAQCRPTLGRRHRVDESMTISHARRSHDLAPRSPRSSEAFVPPPTPERRTFLHAVLVENAQNATDVLLDAAFMGGPILETNAGLERRHLIVVFDVDRQGVSACVHRSPRVAHLGPGILFDLLPRTPAMSTARSGCSRRPATALAIAARIAGRNEQPVSPSRIIAAMSPAPVDTTGSPAARASSTDTGWLSTTDELTNTSADRRGRASPSARSGPRSGSRPAPSEAACCRSRCSSRSNSGDRQGGLRVLGLEEGERLQGVVHAVSRARGSGTTESRGRQRHPLAIPEAGGVHDIPDHAHAVAMACEHPAAGTRKGRRSRRPAAARGAPASPTAPGDRRPRRCGSGARCVFPGIGPSRSPHRASKKDQ